jgi:DNA-binding FrmR family transcriptional regulator
MSKKIRNNMVLRLSRAEGQVRALKQLLESEELQDGKHFLTQIKAARSALKGVSELYVTEYLRTCQSLPERKRIEKTNAVIKLLASD